MTRSSTPGEEPRTLPRDWAVEESQVMEEMQTRRRDVRVTEEGSSRQERVLEKIFFSTLSSRAL